MVPNLTTSVSKRQASAYHIALPSSRRYITGVRKHLAIMHKSAIEAILSGKKTIETRFSQHRICPFGQIEVGDLVYIKPPGEEIIGQFRVNKVFFFGGLEEKDVREIFEKYKSEISVGDALEDQKYLEVKRNSRFATLIFVGESERFITSPVKIRKKDLRGWMVISNTSEV